MRSWSCLALSCLKLGALLLISLPTRSVAAQTVDEARQHFFEARFRQSIESFEDVLSRPSLTRADAVESHRFLATLRHLTGDAESARTHARMSVALDPTVAAPDGSPEEVAAFFVAAQDAFGGETARLEIRAVGDVREGAEIAVEARTLPEGIAVVDTVSLRCVSGGERAEETGQGLAVRVTVTARSGGIDCRATGQTAGHATLLRERVELNEPVPTADVVTPPLSIAAPIEPAPGGNDDGLIWGLAIGGAALALGVVFVVVFALWRPDLANEANFGPGRVEGW